MTAEELAKLALSHGMIDEGELRGEHVYVRLGRETFDLTSEHAAFFLVTMIRASHRSTRLG